MGSASFSASFREGQHAVSDLAFRHHLALAALFALIPVQAVAQSHLVADDHLEAGNAAIITQSGDAHRASIEQLNIQGGLLSGSIQQGGLGNTASISLEGGDLSGSIIQHGSHNDATLDIRDEHNQGAIEQYGNDNSAGLRIEGYGKDVTLIQQGNGHGNGSPIRVGGDTPGGLPITIRQY